MTHAFEPQLPPILEDGGGTLRVGGTRVTLDTVVGAFDAPGTRVLRSLRPSSGAGSHAHDLVVDDQNVYWIDATEGNREQGNRYRWSANVIDTIMRLTPK